VAALFRPRANVVARVIFFGTPCVIAVAAWACLVMARSSWGTGARMTRVQPVAFSHAHHAGELGIDCRYCHVSVETGPHAGMPSTEICMHCHSQIWVGSDMLAPVRDSYRTGQSLVWQRVYNQPAFVYFDHSIHIHKGVGCSTCHGPIDEMPFVYQFPSMLMEWCVDCHRNPARHLRPQEDIFNRRWRPDAKSEEERTVEYAIRDPELLTSCSVCHR